MADAQLTSGDPGSNEPSRAPVGGFLIESPDGAVEPMSESARRAGLVALRRAGLLRNGSGLEPSGTDTEAEAAAQ